MYIRSQWLQQRNKFLQCLAHIFESLKKHPQKKKGDTYWKRLAEFMESQNSLFDIIGSFSFVIIPAYYHILIFFLAFFLPCSSTLTTGLSFYVLIIITTYHLNFSFLQPMSQEFRNWKEYGV